jgi:hypothetical protein
MKRISSLVMVIAISTLEDPNLWVFDGMRLKRDRNIVGAASAEVLGKIGKREVRKEEDNPIFDALKNAIAAKEENVRRCGCGWTIGRVIGRR